MIKNNRLFIYVCFALMTLLSACADAPVPRPYAYFRIDLPEHDYQQTTVFSNCTFDISRYAVIKGSDERWAGEFDEWYNIWYPQFDGTIHLSYKKITPDIFQDISEESRTLAYKHTIRADAISESMFLNDTTRTYGILYEMAGSAASSCQFFISDSTNNFIRGALYFNVLPNPDSIAPVSVYVEQDIIRLIESLKWNK